MQWKVDISKDLWDGDSQSFFEIREGYKVFCVEILKFC